MIEVLSSFFVPFVSIISTEEEEEPCLNLKRMLQRKKKSKRERERERERVGVGVGVGFIHRLIRVRRLIRYKGCM